MSAGSGAMADSSAPALGLVPVAVGIGGGLVGAGLLGSASVPIAIVCFNARGDAGPVGGKGKDKGPRGHVGAWSR